MATLKNAVDIYDGVAGAINYDISVGEEFIKDTDSFIFQQDIFENFYNAIYYMDFYLGNQMQTLEKTYQDVQKQCEDIAYISNYAYYDNNFEYLATINAMDKQKHNDIFDVYNNFYRNQTDNYTFTNDELREVFQIYENQGYSGQHTAQNQLNVSSENHVTTSIQSSGSGFDLPNIMETWNNEFCKMMNNSAEGVHI